ncbi:hypothetical protein K7432_016322, partial [Basidiobolus ranarum]
VATVSLLMPASAGPNHKNHHGIAASLEYVEVYAHAKAYGDIFPATLKTVPAGMEDRFNECFPSDRCFVVRCGADSSTSGGVLVNAIGPIFVLCKGWVKEEKEHGFHSDVTKQRGDKDVSGCQSGF